MSVVNIYSAEPVHIVNKWSLNENSAAAAATVALIKVKFSTET